MTSWQVDNGGGTAVESAVERELSLEIMGGDGKPRPEPLSAGDTLVEQRGDTSEGSPVVYLVLDGVLEVVVDGEVVGELGPGAIVGERAQLEGGTRTATLREDREQGGRDSRRRAEPRGARAGRGRTQAREGVTGTLKEGGGAAATVTS